MAKKVAPTPTKKAPANPKPKDERTQQQRFEDFAREHGATDEVLDRALVDVAKAKPKKG